MTPHDGGAAKDMTLRDAATTALHMMNGAEYALRHNTRFSTTELLMLQDAIDRLSSALAACDKETDRTSPAPNADAVGLLRRWATYWDTPYARPAPVAETRSFLEAHDAR